MARNMASLYALYAASTSTHKLPYIKTFETVKVFAPVLKITAEEECDLLREGQILLTCLYLAAGEAQTRALLGQKVTAARIAAGFGADTTILDIGAERLASIDDIFHGAVSTLYSTEENLKPF
jgi:alanine dehydrogenase